MKKANPGVNFRKADADCKAAVKELLKPVHVAETNKKIRAEFSVEQELGALRTDHKPTKDRIAAIIAEMNTERDSALDIS